MSSPLLLTSSSSTGTLVESFDSAQTARRKSSSSHGSSVTMITTYPSNEEEFARFPEAVRRKYFSSVERLRLTQKSSNNGINNDRLTPVSSVQSTVRPGSNSSDCCKRLNPLRHHHNKKEEPKPQNPKLVIAESDALWYLRLPDSIRRKYFSKEERNILQRRCQEIFPDFAERSIYLLPPRFANRSLTTLTSHSSASLLDSLNPAELEQTHKFTETIARPVSRASSVADTADFASLALPMQNFDSPKPTPAPSEHSSSKRQFVRRSMSLTKNFRQSRQSFTGFVFTASTPSTRSHSHSHSLSQDFSRSSNPLVGNSLDYEASYWQDPEARHKLRLYLASPQNFDEAVEFGFPSLENPMETSTAKSSTKKSEIVETISILTEDTDDKPLNTGLRPRPATSGGVEVNARGPVRSAQTVRESMISRLDVMNTPQNREMTLRMTLTRKDLRATDDEIYGWQEKSSNLLGLDSLAPASQDAALMQIGPSSAKKGTNATNKTWKKIWKKVCHI